MRPLRDWKPSTIRVIYRPMLSLILVCSPTLAPAQPSAKSGDTLLPTSSQFFEFHSGFWINLHHFLYLQARARMKTPDSQRRAIAGARNDLEQISKMPVEQRRAWNAALDYYQQGMALRDLVFDRDLVELTNRLAVAESSPALEASKTEPALVHILAAAAPAYRSLWWSGHNQANRQWLSMIKPLLQKYERSLSQQIMVVYHTKWPSRPFRVDVCAYAIWAGAYTTDDPARITIGSMDEGNRGTQGLETLFHESLHVLEDSIIAELRRQALAQNKRIPPLLSHAVLFYTAGEITRRTVPNHIPYAVLNRIWDREPWRDYLKLLETNWQLYLEGKASFDEALEKIVAGATD